MKLSEAIRLGSMMKPQAFGTFYDDDGGSCVVGAAADAVGLHPYKRMPWHELTFSLNWDTACPSCGRMPGISNGNGTLPHLNDDHRWTRERIAAFVETIENAQAETLAESLAKTVSQ